MKCVVSNKSYFLALTLLALSLPLSIALSNIFYSLTFLLWVAKIVSQGRQSLHRTKLEIPIIVLGIVYILAVFLSPSPLESARILEKLLIFGLFFIVANSLESEAERHRLITIWFLSIIAASLWTVIEYFRGVDRPGGFFGCMTFGHFAAIFLGVSMPLIGLKNYKRTSVLSLSVFAIGAVALFLTRTRGAWIGFIAGLVLFFIIRRKWLFLASFAVGLVLIVSILFVYFPDSGLGKDVTSILQPFDDQTPRVTGSNLRRWHMWEASWRMFKKHPFLGVGPYQFRKELPNYLSEQVKTEIFQHQPYYEAHNIYLDYLATMGAVGFLGLFFFLFSVFRLLVLKYKVHKPGFERNLVLGALIAFASFCVAGFFSQSFHDSEILLNLCFLLGLVL